MELVIITLLLTAFSLILKMVFDSKAQIDDLIQELDEIQNKIEYSLPENKKHRRQLQAQLQNAILANGEIEFQEVATGPYTSANSN